VPDNSTGKTSLDICGGILQKRGTQVLTFQKVSRMFIQQQQKIKKDNPADNPNTG